MILSVLGLLLFASIAAGGQDFDIRAYGAREDALPRENAAAIQKAIDACTAVRTGGRVTVPKGTWVSGTIWLKSGVDLHLEKGAVLKASSDLADYNAEDAYPENYGCADEYWRGLHFIICRAQERVSISGEGEINGNGDAFFEEKPKAYYAWMKPGAECWWDGIRWAKDKKNLRPGQLIVFVKANGIRVRGVTVRNSPCWSLFFHGCRGIEVVDYVVRNGANDGNTDGIDIDCCRDVTLRGLDIDTGDDAVAIRAAGRRLGQSGRQVTAGVRISKCRLNSNSSVFRFGVGDGEIRDVTVEDIVSERGGTAINLNTLYGDPEKNGTDMRDIVFRNCTFRNCRCSYAMLADGKKLEYGIRNVTLDRCRFFGPDGREQTHRWFGGGTRPVENFRIIDQTTNQTKD